jgi:Icc-related predicted phosphoesterase
MILASLSPNWRENAWRKGGAAMTQRAVERVIRLAAVADVHCSRSSAGTLQPLFAQAAATADVLLLAGDLTDYGLPEEAHILVKELSAAGRLPIVAVLGNHDFESGKQQAVHDILCEAGVNLLDGDSCEVRGVGFAGIKGFGGGFGRGTLGLWGEDTIKQFVRETINEALKLESALARLRTEHRIALLHYSPLRETVEGEPPEIFPFLGSSRLEEPLTRFDVTAVFHGHAHHGHPEGHIHGAIPVYNVSLPLLRRTFPDGPPLRMLELRLSTPAADEPAGSHAQPSSA